MIDPDAQRRTFDAVLATHDANARDSAATEARELLREDDDSDFPNVRDLLSPLSRVR